MRASIGNPAASSSATIRRYTCPHAGGIKARLRHCCPAGLQSSDAVAPRLAPLQKRKRCAANLGWCWLVVGLWAGSRGVRVAKESCQHGSRCRADRVRGALLHAVIVDRPFRPPQLRGMITVMSFSFTIRKGCVLPNLHAGLSSPIASQSSTKTLGPKALQW